MVHIDIGSAERFGGFTAMHSPPEGARALLASCWAALPGTYSARDSRDIGGAARAISAQSDALVVLGAGGSYLGARALIEFVRSPEYNMLAASSPRVFFAGNNISAEHAQRLISLLSGRDFSVNIISKTGTTIETSLAFRVFFSLLCAKYGADGAMQRIYVTTGAGTRLDEFARENGCVRFHIPDGVGGRFSVLTAVGLLPAAVAGCDIDAVMAGAREEMESGLSAASLYASARQGLYAAGKKIEILCCFEPCMQYLCEWWKQLFGESEGKDGRGIFPASALFTADLHSLGQYIQQGERTLMETFLTASGSRSQLRVPGARPFDDMLDGVSAAPLHEINAQAAGAVRDAHVEGGVPVMSLGIPDISAESFGALAYFFEAACVISAALSGVDPYGQPGVEAYKRNLKARLGLSLK